MLARIRINNSSIFVDCLGADLLARLSQAGFPNVEVLVRRCSAQLMVLHNVGRPVITQIAAYERRRIQQMR